MSRILVIDDELSIRRLLRILLEGASHTVISADDASHGLHALALEKPDLLILDLGLPDMDGIEVHRQWLALQLIRQRKMETTDYTDYTDY
ncbi:MAG: response regulator [Verrucomicrobiota bacterium]